MNQIILFGKILIFEDGASAIEYAILASAIAAVIAATVFLLGLSVLELFERLVF